MKTRKSKQRQTHWRLKETNLFHLMVGSGEGKKGKIKSQIGLPGFIWGTGWDGGSGLAPEIGSVDQAWVVGGKCLLIY